jgi:hypothetical protein
MVLTLIAWGARPDRIGERWVIASQARTGSTRRGARFRRAVRLHIALGIFFLLGGMAAASAAGKMAGQARFPKVSRRGLRPGIPPDLPAIGVTIAAVTVPGACLGRRISAALIVPLVLTGVLAVACAISIHRDPRDRRRYPGCRPPTLPLERGFLWHYPRGVAVARLSPFAVDLRIGVAGHPVHWPALAASSYSWGGAVRPEQSAASR